jgi:hypothetical protein
MSDKPITWQQGIAVVGGAFGLCCMGFMLLHGMIMTTRAESSSVRTEAADNLSRAVQARTMQMDRISDQFAAYQKENNASHEKIMVLLMKLVGREPLVKSSTGKASPFDEYDFRD